MLMNTLKTKRRFAFWRVFWVVLAMYILIALFVVVAMSVNPVTQNETAAFKKLMQWQRILDQVITFFFIVGYYYFTLNTFYRLMVERKNAIHFIKTCCLIVLVLFAYWFIEKQVFPDEEVVKNHKITTGALLFGYSVATVFYIGVSMLIAYFVYLRDEKKHQKVLEAQKMQLEVEKSAANFNFLKAQINPHFLHNTLNFLYAKSLPYSEELSEGILTLSDIMRYALSEGNARDGKAPLKDEIEHVRNVIKINQLRFSNKLNVQFDVEGVVNGHQIIPFVLITLVENAFKHGDLKSTEYPIDIKVKINNNQLYFYCRNKKKGGPKELSTGIGLDNIKKRLELAYRRNFSFNVKDEAEFYTTELTITVL
jgi:hypothetical protein